MLGRCAMRSAICDRDASEHHARASRRATEIAEHDSSETEKAKHHQSSRTSQGEIEIHETIQSRMGTKHDEDASKEAEGRVAAEEEATDQTNCEGPSLAPADAHAMASSPKIPAAALPKPPPSPQRSFEQELTYLSKLSPTR